MQKQDINGIIRLLVSAYGDRQWSKRLEPVGELVQTILSQNTSDTNSRRAFLSLMNTFGNWNNIALAEEKDIADAIRQGGLADVKAKYISNVLQVLRRQTTGLDLSFLKEMEMGEARKWLQKLPGVGMKTASCVLLFSLHMPSFPVDTHVYRVAKRLGLINMNMSVESAHMEMERITAPQDIYRCHVLLIEHGRKTCKARHPACGICALAGICPSYKLYINEKHA